MFILTKEISKPKGAAIIIFTFLICVGILVWQGQRGREEIILPEIKDEVQEETEEIKEEILEKTNPKKPESKNIINKIFFTAHGQNIFVINDDGTERKKIAQGIGMVISPDNSKIAFNRNETVVVYNLLEDKTVFEKEIPIYCYGQYWLGEFVWTSDSKKLIYEITPIGLDFLEPICSEESIGTVDEEKIYKTWHEDRDGTYNSDGAYIVDIETGEVERFFMGIGNDSYSPDDSRIVDSDGEVTTTEPQRLYKTKLSDAKWLCSNEDIIGTSNKNLYTINIETGEKKQLTFYKSYEEIHRQASERVSSFELLPDCSKIVYKTYRSWLPPPNTDKDLEYIVTTLHVIDKNGENDIFLDSYVQGYFFESGDEKIIFWNSETKKDKNGIYIINVDGTGLKKIMDTELASGPIIVRHVMGSPDGKKIAFMTDDGIYTINIDGTDKKKITEIIELSSEYMSAPGIFAWE